MLICIGGFHGSGRRIFAREVADKLGYHYYDINQKKLRRPLFTKKGLYELVQHPNSDEERTFLYRRTLEDFPLLSKMYPDVVMSAGFYREVPRDEFFKRAQSYFGNVLVVWIERNDSTETSPSGRETKHEERQMQRRISAKKEFQPFRFPIPTFAYVGSTENAKATFCEFVRTQLGALI